MHAWERFDTHCMAYSVLLAMPEYYASSGAMLRTGTAHTLVWSAASPRLSLIKMRTAMLMKVLCTRMAQLRCASGSTSSSAWGASVFWTTASVPSNRSPRRADGEGHSQWASLMSNAALADQRHPRRAGRCRCTATAGPVHASQGLEKVLTAQSCESN